MEAFQQFILWFSVVPVVVAALVGLVRYRRLDTLQRYLLLLTLLALLMEITARTFRQHHQPNLFLAPIDTTLEFSLLALIYRQALRPSRLSRLIPLLLGGFVLGFLISYSPRLDTAQFNSGQRFAESVLVLTFVGSFFHREITRRQVTSRLEREPMFWVSTGLLLYFSGSILIFLSSNYTLQLSTNLSTLVWTMHALLYIFLNMLYTVALALPGRAGPGGAAPAGVTQS